MKKKQSLSTQMCSLEENTILFYARFIWRSEKTNQISWPRESCTRKRYTNILKQNSDIFPAHVQKDINASISALKFPNDLKEADIIPVYKKKSKLSKKTIGQ